MTGREIIRKVQDTEGSSYGNERLLDWLNELEGQIWEQIVLTHADAPAEPFTGHESPEEEMLVPWPWAGELYENYLKAKIAYENAETERYNQCAAMYGSVLQEYRNWYNRKHRPLGHGSLRI